MNWDKNPFQELYLSDSVSEEAFVELFSPVPLTSAINPLFQEGNVVLSGTQGCGKTMILRLFFPETRIAYADKEVPFPVETRAARFVSAGVNLVKSSLCDIGQVTLRQGDEHDVKLLPFFFGDFFNYWVIQDLLRNLRKINARPDVFENIVHTEGGKKFAECLVRQDCWFGLLDGCASLDDVENRVAKRIETYRRWMVNVDGPIPGELATTKTAIGEPIARTVECLKDSGVLDNDVKVFVRVDQLEELHQDASVHQRRVRDGFRQMLNRAFASRDLRLHYRIGTRRYGWNQPEHLTVYGSGARLEARRDYLPIDLEDTLTRKEARRLWTFPRFAADAFSRRVKYDFDLRKLPDLGLFERIFGKQPTPAVRAEKFVGRHREPDQIDRILRLSKDEHWSPEWKNWLRELASEAPLEAVLAAAWGRQTGGRGKTANREKPPPKHDKWMKKWWRKERLMQGVLQLAARRAQRLLWWGSGDVLALSAPNITVFLHLCHAVWDLFLKGEQLKPEPKRQDLLEAGTIREVLQAAGIQSASRQWHDKLGEQPGGDVRRRFIDQLGRKLREQLRDDLPMRYPGANGFSLRRDELEENHGLWRFLLDAVGFGDLVSSEHTTKNKRGEARIKFYVNPALSPVFQIPAAHTKEPLYWNVEHVLEIARAAELPFALPAWEDSFDQNRRVAMPVKAETEQQIVEGQLPLF
jgi:hypothetical protein